MTISPSLVMDFKLEPSNGVVVRGDKGHSQQISPRPFLARRARVRLRLFADHIFRIPTNCQIVAGCAHTFSNGRRSAGNL